MKPAEATAVIEKWNELHTRVHELLELGDRPAAWALVTEMEKLPLDAARNVVYDAASVGEGVLDIFGVRTSEGKQVKKLPALDEGDKGGD